jgi:hypothetical protein
MARAEEFHHGSGTMPNGSFPINNQHQANAAWRLRGRSGTYSKVEIEHHIEQRVKELGLKHPFISRLESHRYAPR